MIQRTNIEYPYPWLYYSSTKYDYYKEFVNSDGILGFPSLRGRRTPLYY